MMTKPPQYHKKQVDFAPEEPPVKRVRDEGLLHTKGEAVNANGQNNQAQPTNLLKKRRLIFALVNVSCVKRKGILHVIVLIERRESMKIKR